MVNLLLWKYNYRINQNNTSSHWSLTFFCNHVLVQNIHRLCRWLLSTKELDLLPLLESSLPNYFFHPQELRSLTCFIVKNNFNLLTMILAKKFKLFLYFPNYNLQYSFRLGGPTFFFTFIWVWPTWSILITSILLQLTGLSGLNFVQLSLA